MRMLEKIAAPTTASPEPDIRQMGKLTRFTPKLVSTLRERYSVRRFGADAGAGLTVAIIALPLAMALGIASIPANVAEELRTSYPGVTLSPPAIGLYTAVVAGFIISLLGGSRVQVGGPTAAFIPIVFGIAMSHGYEGLALATLMAGVMVVLMGLFRFGAMIKFIPYPVTTGFTSGIAVTILVSQLQSFAGLRLYDEHAQAIGVPADFVPKLQLLASHADTISWHSLGIGAGSLAALFVMRKFIPRVPGAIVVVVLSSVIVHVFGWSQSAGFTMTGIGGEQVSRPLVETIGTRFTQGIPKMLPAPHLPRISFELVRELIPSAVTIALLCAIESLLSAVVADGMTGHRHKSDQELMAQGVANMASACIFGLPATGAIARTVANIKSGGSTPVAGLLHAVFLLLFMMAMAPLAKLVPLPTLAAVLILVAWNISEIDHFRSLLRAPRSDVVVLLSTFGLTVFTDLTIAVGVGMVLASMLFMKRMAEVSNVSSITKEFNDAEMPEDPKDPGSIARTDVPRGVEMYEIDGPFFFGVADRLKDTLNQFEKPPKVFILRMRNVPHIDATGLHALEEFIDKCRRQHIRLLLGGVHAQPLYEFVRTGLDKRIGLENIFENLQGAIDHAREIITNE